MKKQRILVTGGTGFLGSALVKRLVKEGHQVRVLDNQLRGKKERLNDLDIEWTEGDIRDADLVKKACQNCDVIFHLAFINGTEFFYQKPDLVLEVGVKGILNILEGAKANQIKDFFLASSSEVYQLPTKIPTNETVPLVIPDALNPRYSYGGGKLISEIMTINFARKNFNRSVIFRPHNVYGPDMGWEHVIPQIVLKIKNLKKSSKGGNLKVPIQGSGKETRAFIFIEDFIDGLLLLLKNGKHQNIYHIGTMDEISIESLVHHIGDLMRVQIDCTPGQLSEGSTPRRCPDIAKMKALGFNPETSLLKGLEKTVRWYEQNAHLKPEKSAIL